MLATRDAAGAWAEVLRTRQVLDGFQLGQRDLTRLAQTLWDTGHWNETVAAYEELIDRFASEADVGRLLLAEVLIERQGRPTAALRHLHAIDRARLTGKQAQHYERLQHRAEELLNSGVIELEGRAWQPTVN